MAMYGFRYETLKRIVETNKPYRPSKAYPMTNRYPLSRREHTYKYFLVEEVNGKIEYHVIYGYTYESVNATKQEHDEAIAKGNGYSWEVREIKKADGSSEYIRYVKTPNRLGVVRNDNTFEFTANALNQGERMFLSANVIGYFKADSRRGGVVHHARWSATGSIIPIFKGLRVDIETMKPTADTAYEILIPRVDRQAAKEATAKLEEPLAIGGMLIKTMDFNALKSELKEALETGEKLIFNMQWWDKNKAREAKNKAVELLYSDPLRGVALSMIANNVGSAKTIAQGYGGSLWHDETIEDMFDKTVAKIHRDIYIKEDTFKYESFSHGDKFPTSVWSPQVKVNGKAVERYL